jgi:diketogulonate reductase-like aldo/keto reductase
MVKERDAGRTRMLGVSNVSLRHLQQMAAIHPEAPAFVQNRCYARLGWDRDVRAFCRERKIVYQGFSLLTANINDLRHPAIGKLITGIAQREGATFAQVVFRFAQAVGMLPLTGTTDAEHMREDLACRGLTLKPEEVQAIESMAG